MNWNDMTNKQKSDEMEYLQDKGKEKIVSRVFDPKEIEEAQMRITNIHFECYANMYESGYVKRDLSLHQGRKFQPQWFKANLKLTLDFIESARPEQIGMAIQNMLKQLKDEVKKYENQ